MSLPLFIKHVLCLFAVLAFAGAYAANIPEFAEGRILVKPAAGLSEAKLEQILERSRGKSKRKLRGLDVHVVEVPVRAEAAVARALSRNKNIAFAELDQLLEPVVVPSDPDYGKQWHLPKMQAPDAWAYGDGTGVTVAVLDTGVFAGHADLSGRVLTGWNTVSQNTDTADVHNHGTWVAGVIAARANNGVGGASVAPGAKILPVRITNRSDGLAYFSDMAEGITWAADHGARVANLSYHGAAGSQTIANAGSYMLNRGGVAVVAAGNDNSDYGYGNFPSLLVVAATSKSDTKSSYSSYGAFVDVSAPGDDIYTTSRSGGYSTVSGTSFATPNTAAVAALVMSANPGLNPTDVTAVIISTVADLGAAGWDPGFGYGRVNARAAAELAANADTSDVTAPTAKLASPGQGATVSGVVDIVLQASDGFGVTKVELLIDGRVAATEISGSNGDYLFAWDSTAVRDASYQLSASAYDAAGNVGTAPVLTVRVANVQDKTPPQVTISSPNGGSYDRRVTLSAFASDDQAVVRLDVFGDNKLLCSGTTNASCTWNLRKVGDGVHSVTATAFDAAGNQASASTTFTKGSDNSTETDSGNTRPGKGSGRKK